MLWPSRWTIADDGTDRGLYGTRINLTSWSPAPYLSTDSTNHECHFPSLRPPVQPGETLQNDNGRDLRRRPICGGLGWCKLWGCKAKQTQHVAKDSGEMCRGR